MSVPFTAWPEPRISPPSRSGALGASSDQTLSSGSRIRPAGIRINAVDQLETLVHEEAALQSKLVLLVRLPGSALGTRLAVGETLFEVREILRQRFALATEQVTGRVLRLLSICSGEHSRSELLNLLKLKPGLSIRTRDDGARQFWRLRGVHGYSMDDEQTPKMTAKRPPALA
jgi:hypothetical protein